MPRRVEEYFSKNFDLFDLMDQTREEVFHFKNQTRKVVLKE